MQSTVLRTLVIVLALCLFSTLPIVEGQGWASNLGHHRDTRQWMERTYAGNRDHRGLVGNVQPRAEAARYPLQKLMPLWTASKRENSEGLIRDAFEDETLS